MRYWRPRVAGRRALVVGYSRAAAGFCTRLSRRRAHLRGERQRRGRRADRALHAPRHARQGLAEHRRDTELRSPAEGDDDSLDRPHASPNLPNEVVGATTRGRAMTAEHDRLEENRTGRAAWLAWGPYLSERQWGTVREDYSAGGDAWDYLPHDQARSRAYRWGEDGIAGISDDHQRLCFSLALWNGVDPDPQGAHVRADEPRGEPRRGLQGLLVLPGQHAHALVSEDCCTSTRRASSPTATSSRRTAGAPATSSSTS